MKSIHVLHTGERIPVGKIICVGRNYREHAREMKSEVGEDPILFIKPSTAIIQSGDEIVMPPFSRELHHEVEFVILIGREGKNIPPESAYEYVFGYGVGLDMTLRDVQRESKKLGLPWSVAKGFDTSAPISDIVPKD
ncbi:MAG TPA: fumarylacetoacetate hydrolase family protein, partial [Bacteroidota bacterium]